MFVGWHWQCTTVILHLFYNFGFSFTIKKGIILPFGFSMFVYLLLFLKFMIFICFIGWCCLLVLFSLGCRVSLKQKKNCEKPTTNKQSTKTQRNTILLCLRRLHKFKHILSLQNCWNIPTEKPDTHCGLCVFIFYCV